MHRVELKDTKGSLLLLTANVPNAPCGVERLYAGTMGVDAWKIVPNAPCGVESFTLISSPPKSFFISS